MERSGYIHELGDEQAVITREPKETLVLIMVMRVGHFLIASILPLSVTIP